MATYTFNPNSAPENPISDGGAWNTTMPASWTTNVQTSSSPKVILGPDSSGSNDSVAFLTGFGPNQTINATSFVGAGATSPAEIELHLRGTVDVAGNTIKTYEIDIVPSLSTVFVVRWNGAQGAVTTITTAAIPSTPVDGDTWQASVTGGSSAVKIIVLFNTSTVIDGTTLDTAGYATGQPGIGFDAGNVASGSNFGIKMYTVTDGLGGGKTASRLALLGVG